ncbi:MAG TPA: hypothetical protein VGL81_30900 [Polyangiaceae bacterium]|jgi:hypothetical protein
MKTIRLVCAIALATALVAAPALADTTTWPSAKVSVDAPAGWTSTIKGNQVLLATAKGDIAVDFVTVPAGAAADAGGAAGRQLGKVMDKVTVKNNKPVTVNGMKGAMVDGTGTLKGAPVVWLLLILDTPATDVDLMGIAIGVDSTVSAHKADLDHIFNSLKPTG